LEAVKEVEHSPTLGGADDYPCAIVAASNFTTLGITPCHFGFEQKKPPFKMV
jgi:hypothetical protein